MVTPTDFMEISAADRIWTDKLDSGWFKFLKKHNFCLFSLTSFTIDFKIYAFVLDVLIHQIVNIVKVFYVGNLMYQNKCWSPPLSRSRPVDRPVNSPQQSVRQCRQFAHDDEAKYIYLVIFTSFQYSLIHPRILKGRVQSSLWENNRNSTTCSHFNG